MSCEFFKGVRQLFLDCYQGLGWGAVPSDDVSGPGVVLLIEEMRRSPVEIGSLSTCLSQNFSGFYTSQVGCWGFLNHQQVGPFHFSGEVSVVSDLSDYSTSQKDMFQTHLLPTS